MNRLKTLPLTCLFLLVSSTAFSQEWAEKMFNEREHNFGTVARGAETVYKFEVTNLYKQPMTIVGVRTSCNCTTPSIENATIKTHEKAYIVCKFNTHTHTGQKAATVTVTFGAPFPAEVQVRVHGNIRSDVVFTPGSIEFGEVAEGATREQVISVNYAGRENWEIVDVTNDNEHFEVELKEQSRENGRVSYALLVRLKDDLPVGYLKDQLTIVTNDTRADAQRIPLFIGGHIRPEFSVTPRNIILGTVVPGEELTKRIVVRGNEPFRIIEVQCDDECFDFKVDPASKQVHLVELRFKAGEQPGKLRAPINIVTDRGEKRGATCVASAIVDPKAKPARAADVTTAKPVSASTAR